MKQGRIETTAAAKLLRRRVQRGKRFVGHFDRHSRHGDHLVEQKPMWNPDHGADVRQGQEPSVLPSEAESSDVGALRLRGLDSFGFQCSN